MKENYSNHRHLLIGGKLKSIRQFFGTGVPISSMGEILDISVGKCHYLLRHPEQINPGYLGRLDEYFQVPGDTFWDLCEYQWRREFAKHALKTWSLDYWCLRKSGIKHR